MFLFTPPHTNTGGGLSVQGSAQMAVVNCELRSNAATTVAGAILAAGSVSLQIARSSMVNNTASRVSAILAYNDDNRARYSLHNNTIVTSRGAAALMLGRIELSGFLRIRGYPSTDLFL
jgi:hypothetical protein